MENNTGTQSKTNKHLADDLFLTCDNERELNDFKRIQYIALYYNCGTERKEVFKTIFDKFREHYNAMPCMADSPKIYSEILPLFSELLADDFKTFFVGEEVVKEVNGKQPISNGSINASLTLAELLKFDIGRKAGFIHNLNVSGEFAHSFKDIENVIFEKLEPVCTWKQRRDLLEKLDELSIDAALTLTFENYQKHAARMQAKTSDYLYNLGYEMPDICQKFKIRGELKMALPQLQGYIAKSGSWNDFNVSNVSKALQHIENTFPRVNYGDNNCNTGRKQHEFSIMSDYIFTSVTYVNGRELEVIKKWFEENKNEIQRTSKCDSIRFESNDYEHDGHDFKLVMWWD